MVIRMVHAFVLLLVLVFVGKSTADICKNAKHRQHCMNSIKALGLDLGIGGGDNTSFFSYLAATRSMNLAFTGTKQLLQVTSRMLREERHKKQQHKQSALEDCLSLLTDACELISDSTTSLKRHQKSKSSLEDAHTWLSAALAHVTTCFDGMTEKTQRNLVKSLRGTGERVEKSLSTALSLVATLHPKQHSQPVRKRTPYASPLWSTKTIGNFSFQPNVTVALDGTGDFTNITAAIAAAPAENQGTKYTIYIKSGTYNERFEIPRIQNLVLVGDGIGKTIITGNRSVQEPNITTFNSATVAVRADGIVVRDVTFQNTAGAINHQAVAVRVQADKVVFFRCSFEGYQDTLYAHSLRQLYAECDIYGTVDYIFGDAAAVFQNCNLYARVGLPKQKNTYTAQGKTDPNENTGYAFQNCMLDGVEELKQNVSNFPTYLGRPWKEYSTTIFIKSYESSVLHPDGWLPWNGSFALATVFYAEYFCYGPGSATDRRVNWSTQVFDAAFASRFSVANFLSGNDWVLQTNMPVSLGL